MNYVSYWPAESADFGVMGALFGKNQKADSNTSFEQDVRAEGYLPDHIIEMTTNAEKEKKMLAAWIAIMQKASGPSYRTLRKNCSTICSRILHEGGFYAKKWAVDSNFAWSPADIKKLALAAGGTQMTWDEFLVVYKASFMRPENLVNSKGTQITQARDSALCSTGAPCRLNRGR